MQAIPEIGDLRKNRALTERSNIDAFVGAFFVDLFINMISIEQARKKLGKTGTKMNDKQIELFKNNLYALIGQILDNNIEKIKLCKRQ